ncbi:cell division cycle-associated protein 2 isoform X2 [Denticeps clupeoides]|uniref:PP1-binding domain-containing protein n=1 Tax=Denticeps clupeoides TaxID=299321 RepID=A0AAY4BGI1_9TELE|nr:cell division cycle-associated protein 2 isoform X2 [Denticeps clupeoides]
MMASCEFPLNPDWVDTPVAPSSPQQHSGVAALDFSHLTPSQFGISSGSFSVPSKRQDKSRLSQLKARRRSTVGLRGSPETNSLIRYMARQRMTPSTPEHLQSKPLQPRCQTLKEKMAAFQVLMGLDEEEKLQAVISPRKDVFEDGLKTSKPPSENWSSAAGKENRATPGRVNLMTPPLSKRRCQVTLQESEEKIEGALLPVLMCPLLPEEKVPCPELKRPSQPEDSELKNPSHPVLSKCEMSPGNLVIESLSKKKRVCFAAPLSPEFFDKTLPPSTPLQKGGTPSCQSTPGNPVIESLSKKKQVRFGAPLSPEFFDKTLPPSTPLQKGGTPSYQTTPGGSKLRSLLKTPQRHEPPLPQPDFSSPEASAASPAHNKSDSTGGTVSSEIMFRDGEAKVPPLVIEEDNGVTVVNSTDPKHGVDLQVRMDPRLLCEEPAVESVPTAVVTLEQQPPVSTAALTSTRGRKRKLPVEGDSQLERKRPSRTAAVSANGKMKGCSGKRHFGSKEVDRSLYGKRDYASKDPLLSPIFEDQLSAKVSTTSTLTDHTSPTDGDLNPVTHGQASSTSDLIVAAARWRKRFCPQPSHDVPEDSHPIKMEQDTGSLQRADSVAAADKKQSSADSTSIATTKAAGRPQNKTPKGKSSSRKVPERRSRGRKKAKVPPGGGTEEELGHVEHRGENEQKDGKAILEAESLPSSDIDRPTSSESSHTRHDPASLPNTEEGGDQIITQPGKDQKAAAQVVKSGSSLHLPHVGEKDETIQSTSGGEMVVGGGEVPESVAVPQTDAGTVAREAVVTDHPTEEFDIDDVLKPVSSSRRSVRRSLRNQSAGEHQASGLAWVDRTSPEYRGGRRKTRSRLSANLQTPQEDVK